MTTYTEKLPKMVDPKDGRVHTTFEQAVAVTGRLSSTNPNLQNIPIRTEEGRKVREAFIAAPGCKLISADYSQIELRIMAHLSADKRLVEAFKTMKIFTEQRLRKYSVRKKTKSHRMTVGLPKSLTSV